MLAAFGSIFIISGWRGIVYSIETETQKFGVSTGILTWCLPKISVWVGLQFRHVCSALWCCNLSPGGGYAVRTKRGHLCICEAWEEGFAGHFAWDMTQWGSSMPRFARCKWDLFKVIVDLVIFVPVQFILDARTPLNAFSHFYCSYSSLPVLVFQLSPNCARGIIQRNCALLTQKCQ